MNDVSVTKVVACKACGQVFGTEGWHNITPHCPVVTDGRHQIVWVPVVVPLI